MRPYLVIIRDSFHEALVSRVLWILLGVTTLFLLALLPLGIIVQAGSRLTDDDILGREKLIAKIVAEGKSPEPSPGRRIWELLDDSAKQSLARQATDPQDGRRRQGILIQSLQKMISRRDFYRASDWANTKLSPAARTLAAKTLADLPDDQLARFNRLALDAAYPEDIAPIPPKQVQLAYFSWELGLPLPVEPEQLFPAINQLVVAALATILGVGGVFVAVLVTASMIPQTFEAGSVDLLLSKPIFRGWLFLAKFVGGCAFIAINAAYFIGGLWLILGVRFGLWNERLLLAIPLYLFLFAIYYGASSLAGIVWRNAIVSVVMAVLFWFVCWTLGTATQLVEGLSLNPRRLVTVVPAGDALIAVNSRGDLFRWSDSDSDWQKTFVARGDNQMPFMFANQLAGPVYDPAGKRILAFKVGIRGFAPLQAANRLLVGKAADDWQREEGVNVPDAAFTLFVAPRGDILAVSSQGIYRLEGDLEARQQDINVFGFHIPLPEKGGRFVNVDPKLQMRPLQSAAIDPASGAIAVFDGHRLELHEPDAKGAYHRTSERSFERKLRGDVALTDGRVFLVLEGEVQPYDLKLEPLERIPAEARSLPDEVAVSPDGRTLAVVFHNGRLWLYDVAEKKVLSPSIAGQGDVAAVAFNGRKMFVADRLTRVTQYDLDALAIDRQWQGDMPLAEKIYRYGLHPLYTIFPKPSQLNQTVTYLLTAKDSTPGAVRFDDDGPRSPVKLDVWGPVWSNSAFLAVVLLLACVYVHRKDF